MPDHRDLIRAAQLEPRDADRMARGFYTAKARVYRDTLSELAHRHGAPRARVVLSAEIRAALRAEAEDHARKVVATYNGLLGDFAQRERDLPRGLFARKLQGWQRERARKRGQLISKVETSTARLDALVSFYRENGVEPDFEFVGPPPKCPVCRELKRTSPHPVARVLQVGYPHIGCTHRWRARTRAAATLRAGGIRPGQISAGRGGVAGIVGGQAFVTQHGDQDRAAAALRAALGGSVAKAAWDESKHQRTPAGQPGGGQFKPKNGKKRKRRARQLARRDKAERRRFNNRVKAMTPEQREAIVQAFYDALWEQVAPYLNATGQTAPAFIFADLPPGQSARVSFDANGMRRLEIDYDTFKVLLYRSMARRGPGANILAHEWRHFFQDADLFFQGRDLPHDQQPLEADAIAFARAMERQLAREQAKRKRKRRGTKGKLPKKIPFPPLDPLDPAITTTNAPYPGASAPQSRRRRRRPKARRR